MLLPTRFKSYCFSMFSPRVLKCAFLIREIQFSYDPNPPRRHSFWTLVFLKPCAQPCKITCITGPKTTHKIDKRENKWYKIYVIVEVIMRMECQVTETRDPGIRCTPRYEALSKDPPSCLEFALTSSVKYIYLLLSALFQCDHLMA